VNKFLFNADYLTSMAIANI